MSHAATDLDTAAAVYRPATAAYARTFCHEPREAEALVADAVERCRRTTVHHGGPESAWLPFLLTAVRRTAGEWAVTPRAALLSPQFRSWFRRVTDAFGPADPIRAAETSRPVARAYQALSDRLRYAIWHTVIEAEPATAEDTADADSAIDALRDTYLRQLADDAEWHECHQYSRMLGAMVRRTNQHASPDLELHLAQCGACRRAWHDLAVVVADRGDLAAELLLWGSDEYLAERERAERLAAEAASVPQPPPPGPRRGLRRLRPGPR